MRALSTGWIFLGMAAVLGGVVLAAGSDPVLPNSNRGYAPVQPVPFSHRLHAGELGLECLFCHHGARQGARAGVPETGLCMNCHATVTAGFDALSAERLRAADAGEDAAVIVSTPLAELYRFAGWDPVAAEPLAESSPVPWVRVYQMPDFVAFDHSVHVARGLACQTCHGPVQAMERLRQELDLTMGWCIECHRSQPVRPVAAEAAARVGDVAEAHVSTDCAVCHY